MDFEMKYRIRQIPFIFEKKSTEYFLQLLFLFENTILPVNNRKYFIQMAVSTGHALA